MKVHELVARFAPAGESTDPLQAAQQVLEKLAGDLGEVDAALDWTLYETFARAASAAAGAPNPQ